MPHIISRTVLHGIKRPHYVWCYNQRFEGLVAVKLLIFAFWVIMLCGQSALKMEVVCLSRMLGSACKSVWHYDPWDQHQHVIICSPPLFLSFCSIVSFIILFTFRIAYYAKQSDIQMAAMLCCTFGCRSENQDTLKNKQLSKSVNVSVSIKIIVHISCGQCCTLTEMQLCAKQSLAHHCISFLEIGYCYLAVVMIALVWNKFLFFWNRMRSCNIIIS
jgi:hypothetical protein